jgi:hypothetical protein
MGIGADQGIWPEKRHELALATIGEIADRLLGCHRDRLLRRGIASATPAPAWTGPLSWKPPTRRSTPPRRAVATRAWSRACRSSRRWRERRLSFRDGQGPDPESRDFDASHRPKMTTRARCAFAVTSPDISASPRAGPRANRRGTGRRRCWRGGSRPLTRNRGARPRIRPRRIFGSLPARSWRR